jgi:hypothetical protein
MSRVKCAFVAAALAACGGGNDGPKNDGPPPPAYPLNGIASFEYTLNITVGGSQTFDVVLDTGSTPARAISRSHRTRVRRAAT